MKKTNILLIFLLTTLLSCDKKSNNHTLLPEEEPREKVKYLQAEIEELESFCRDNNYNTRYGMIADMSIHSGKYRFFVIDFKGDSILHSGLVSHGVGGGSTEKRAVFSNEVGSHCTSLGKFKIGKRAYSNWGIHVHYKLHGLEETNSNAYIRMVVLHSFSPVSDREIYPLYTTCHWSEGCPVISDQLMRIIDELLKENKDVILWIINGAYSSGSA